MGRARTDLERELLRKGVGALTRDRHACADCGRTPLAGERVYVYERDRVVCALCRAQRRDEPVRTTVVRHLEHGQAVRAATRAA